MESSTDSASPQERSKDRFQKLQTYLKPVRIYKIFFKCILKCIETLAEQGDLFTDKQHGFRKGRSTVSAARVLQREIARAMDDNNYVAVASLDLSSAFDVVNIDLLLTRLAVMGLPRDILELLTEWLTSRVVEVEGSCSEFFDVASGTVQGSVLGPVLFNLFISLLLEDGSGPVYADDSYHLAISRNKADAVSALQQRIIESERWLSGSGLKVNLG
jgi:retron-type reverse transcriptase